MKREKTRTSPTTGNGVMDTYEHSDGKAHQRRSAYM